MKKQQISIIAAIGKKRELGKNNKLLWHIPEDLKRFKKLTSGHAVIMGRKTFESVGRPLPNRLNIIVTRDHNFTISARPCKDGQVFICYSLEQAIEIASQKYKNEIFIIGGGEIYRQAIKLMDKLYLTVVDKEFPEADTFFPDYSRFKKKVFEEKGKSGGYQYRFVILKR